MNPHNRKPLYYKSFNPGLSEVGEVASGLFQWDETNNKPAEVGNGKSFMPPQEIEGEYIIWSDTYTLGYTIQSEAAPIFFSDGGAGNAKILQMINTVAFRLGEGIFDDVVSAMTWAASESRIYVKDSFNPSQICDPNVTQPILGNAAGGASNLYFMDTVVFRIGTSTLNGISVGPFETFNLTKTYACTLEYYKNTDSIGSTNWAGYNQGLWTNAVTPGVYNIIGVGAVVYRDASGNNYFPENAGFMIQTDPNAAGSIRDSLNWVSVGANGVVTSIVPMNTL